jgi:putative hemolysin
MTDSTPILTRGRFRARLAESAADLDAALALRQHAFRLTRPDRDRFDSCAHHVLIEDVAAARLVCCFRLQIFPTGHALREGYAAQVYELSALARLTEPAMELGRFCIAPGLRDADILRVAWATITGLVDARGVALLFGCSSFAGVDPGPYADAFAALHARHLAPEKMRPGVRATDVLRFDQIAGCHDPRRALRQMPPLLRSYLSMGGWVSDHAVIDRQMNTLHVFTGVEVGAIPPARKRLLRALAS